MNENQKKERGAVQTFGHLPPHSTEAEQALLGCCLSDPKETLAAIIAKLKKPEAFYEVRHQNLFRHLMVMHEHAETIDMVTVTARVTVGDCEREVGGIAYVASLIDMTPSAAAFEAYLGIVWEKYLMRQFIKVCTNASGRLMEMEEGQAVAEVLDQVEQEIFAVNQERVETKDLDWKAVLQKSVDLIEEYHRGHGQLRGIATGFDYLDKMCCGMSPGQMIVLAGRPGTGKTSMGFNIVDYVAVELHLPVGVFSLEMTGEELGARSIFQRAGSDFQRFRTGFLENGDIPKLISATTQLSKASIFLDDSGSTTIMDIRAKARRWHAEHGIQMLLIDYLQLVNGSGRFRERRDEVTEISKGLKALAKELHIPIVVLAQLNRDSEKEKRVPRLADLGDSGAIERDADMVGILWEPKLRDEEQQIVDEQRDWAVHSRRINLHICKQRNGPTGPVEFLFQKASMRFISYKRAAQQEEQKNASF